MKATLTVAHDAEITLARWEQIVSRKSLPPTVRELVEHVTEVTHGSPRVNVAEARKALEIGRQAANARLVALKDEICANYPGDDAIAPAPVSELALAWVRAV